jgi:hypothetical protein
MIRTIKHLLYDEGLTLAGARRRLFGEEDRDRGSSAPQEAGRKKSKKTARRQATGSPADRVKRREKKGLPAGGDRNRVSLEELLPGNAAASGTPAGQGAEKKLSRKGGRAGTSGSPGGDHGDDAGELRKTLSVVLEELRDLLTYLHKGDK